MNPDLKDQFENLFDALHCKTIYSSLYNIIFMYRRSMTAVCLVFWSDHPDFQILALLLMALGTIGYIAIHKPFEESKMNNIEIFNEVCVVFSMYTIMLFMLTDDVWFCDAMTVQFIVVVGINVFYFAVQLVPELIYELYDIRV